MGRRGWRWRLCEGPLSGNASYMAGVWMRFLDLFLRVSWRSISILILMETQIQKKLSTILDDTMDGFWKLWQINRDTHSAGS